MQYMHEDGGGGGGGQTLLLSFTYTPEEEFPTLVTKQQGLLSKYKNGQEVYTALKFYNNKYYKLLHL